MIHEHMREHQRIAEFCAGHSLPLRNEYRVPCPFHGGRANNLSVKQGDIRPTIVKCFSRGCTAEDIFSSIPSYLLNDGAFVTISDRRPTAHRSPKSLTLRRDVTKATAEWAERIWANCHDRIEDLSDHAYMKAKGFTHHYGARLGVMPEDKFPLAKGDLLVVIPMRDENDCFTGVHCISDRRDERGWVKRSFGSVGMFVMSSTYRPDAHVFIAVEGWATGATIIELMGQEFVPIVCFGSQLDRAAGLFHQRHGIAGHDVTVILQPDDENNYDIWDYANTPELNHLLTPAIESIKERVRWAS